MNKITFSNTTLTCTFQKSDELLESQCLIGVFSKTPKGFRFEEAIRKSRPPRNPKLYDGKFISMVKMQNGRYQLHLKTMLCNLFLTGLIRALFPLAVPFYRLCILLSRDTDHRL